MVFFDTAERVNSTLRPHWSEATTDRATVVQAVPDMLEIVPLGTSKGKGVKMLLDHLGVTANEVWQSYILRYICGIVFFSPELLTIPLIHIYEGVLLSSLTCY